MTAIQLARRATLESGWSLGQMHVQTAGQAIVIVIVTGDVQKAGQA